MIFRRQRGITTGHLERIRVRPGMLHRLRGVRVYQRVPSNQHTI